MNEFICFVCVHKIKEHPAKNQSVSSFLKCLKFLLLLDECLSAFFHMSKTRFKRFSQQPNGIICITAHIIYTYFVICIRQVEDVLPPDRWLDSLSLSRKKNRSINSSTSCMQLTKNVHMMRAVMQIIPFCCWENLLNLILDTLKKALKHLQNTQLVRPIFFSCQTLFRWALSSLSERHLFAFAKRAVQHL